jgi:hypothetical protein
MQSFFLFGQITDNPHKSNVELVDVNNVQAGGRHWRESRHSRSSVCVVVDNASRNAQGNASACVCRECHIPPPLVRLVQSDSAAVSVFVHDLKAHSARSALARNAFKRVKTVRHPYVLG